MVKKNEIILNIFKDKILSSQEVYSVQVLVNRIKYMSASFTWIDYKLQLNVT